MQIGKGYHATQTIRFIGWTIHPDGCKEICDIMEFRNVKGARRKWRRVIENNMRSYHPDNNFTIDEYRGTLDGEDFKLVA